MLDWQKPIQFANGDPCELIATHPEGTPNFPDCTRIVRRSAVSLNPADKTDLLASLLWFKEDGASKNPAFCVVNIP